MVLVGAMRLTALSGTLAGFVRDLHGTSGVAKPPLLACWSLAATSASRCTIGCASFSVSSRLALSLIHKDGGLVISCSARICHVYFKQRQHCKESSAKGASQIQSLATYTCTYKRLVAHADAGDLAKQGDIPAVHACFGPLGGLVEGLLDGCLQHTPLQLL